MSYGIVGVPYDVFMVTFHPQCIILFTAAYTLERSWKLQEYILKIKTYLNLVKAQLQFNKSWFRMKLRAFHTIMFSLFLLTNVKDMIIAWSRPLFFCAISPFIPFLSSHIYWGSITLSSIGLLGAEAMQLFKYKPPTLSSAQYAAAGPTNLMFQATFSHPLPKHYCAFNGVQLLPIFTGWITKLGKQFGGYIPSMHQIGINTIYYIQLNCSSARHIILPDKKTPRLIFKKSICTMVQLLLIIMLSIQSRYAAGFTVSTTPQESPDISKCHHEHWDINELDRNTCIQWETSNQQNINHLVTNIEQALCFTTIDDDQAEPLIMHNVATRSSKDERISFSGEPTEFGTDNCATHHICSLLSLFTDMRPAPTIGVTGVAGSLQASGIGTIKFILTDDQGLKHNIQLKNVIYLPESAKNLISTTQWSKDKADNCGVLSRGTFSTFMWDNDTKRKHIAHPPSCPIPLMPVNEDDEAFILHISAHKRSYPDNDILLPNGAPPPLNDATMSTSDRDTKLDQQSNNVPSTGDDKRMIPIGSTVWHATQQER